jgi:hypothetical protein
MRGLLGVAPHTPKVCLPMVIQSATSATAVCKGLLQQCWVIQLLSTGTHLVVKPLFEWVVC